MKDESEKGESVWRRGGDLARQLKVVAPLLPADVKLLNTVIVRVNDVQRPMAIDGQTVRSEKLARFSPLVLTKAA